NASVADFVTISGNLGFKKSGAEIIAVGSSITVELTAGPASVKLEDAGFGLQTDGTDTVFELSGSNFSAVITGLASITATSVLVQYNSSASTVFSATTLTVGAISYTFGADIAADTVAFAVTGFNASVADFVTISGNLGFKKYTDDNSTPLDDTDDVTYLIAVGASVTASLVVGPASVKLENAGFGLQVNGSAVSFELKSAGAAGSNGFSAVIDGLASVTADSVLVQYTSATGAVTAGTTISVGATLSYTFTEAIANSTVAFAVGGFSANIFDFLQIFGGSFAFKKSTGDFIITDASTHTSTALSGVSYMEVGGHVATAFAGVGSIGFNLTTLDFGMVMMSSGGVNYTALKADVASASLVGINGLTAISSLSVIINRTSDTNNPNKVLDFKDTDDATNATDNAATARSIATGPTTPDVSLNIDGDEGSLLQVSGGLTLQIAGFVSLTGNFGFKKTGTKLLVGAAGITTFLGTSDESMGVQVTNADLGMVLYQDGTYALDASATAALVGFDNILTLSGTVGVRVNTTGGAVNESLDVNGQTVNIVFSAAQGNVQGFSGTNVTLAIAGFVTLNGSFAFEKSGTAPNTKILVGASGINAFLGVGADTQDPNDDMGVLVKNANLGLVLYSNQTYALDASASAELVGFDNILTLSGTVGVRVNTTNGAVNETVVVGTDTVNIIFSETQGNVQGFSGSVDLTIVDFVTISGGFGFEKEVEGSVTRLLVGAANINAFLGVGADTETTDDDIGIQVKDANLGLLLIKNGTADATYALDASGTAALVGLDGLIIEGSLGVRINKTGQTVDETISTPAGDVNVKFTTAENIQAFSGSVTIKVAEVFVLSGSITAIQRANGTVFVDIPNVSLSITVDGTEMFGISAAARFSISPADGFRLMDMRVTEFTLFGVTADASPNYVGDATDIFNAGLNLGNPPPPDSPPDATLAFPLMDGQIDARTLNLRKYIDVTYNDYSGTGLNISSITDADAEFNLSGVGDAQLSSVVPLNGTTFRYSFTDKDTSNDIDLFIPGLVSVSFVAGGWYDQSATPKANLAETETFTVVDGRGAATKTLALGPLSLEGPSVGIEDFQFKMVDKEGTKIPRLLIMIGLGLDRAALDFGSEQSGSGVKVELLGLMGAFEVAVDLDITDPDFPFVFPDISATGRFAISVDELYVDIPKILKVEGFSISVNYDPNYDPAAHNGESQQIIEVVSLEVEIIPISLKGALTQYTRTDGTIIPGLSVRTDGFRLGDASLQYTGEISLGTILKIKGIKAGVTDFGITFGQAFSFDGEVYIAADGAWLFPGSSFEGSITDGPDADTEAVRAAITFTGNVPDGFKFHADQFSFKFASVLEIYGSGFDVDTNAECVNNVCGEVVAFDSLGAKLSAGPLNIGGEMRHFAFLADGSFKTNPGFGVFFSTKSATGDSIGWPSFIPIQITELGIEWPDINNDPFDFVLTVSASVTSFYGLPIQVTGGVDGIKIDLGELAAGRFPIVDIAGIAVGIEGDLFGGTIKAGLIGGIIKVDDQGNMIPSNDPNNTPVHDRILFMGVEGGFEIPAMGGMFIRFALSELGPLSVFISAAAPTGIIIEPHIGLTLGDFSGGVEFFTSLPSIREPSDLRDPAFGLPTEMTADQWLADVKQKVVNQYNAMKGNSNLPGFLAAFISPMVITGGGKIYSSYASKATFNGEVVIKISTDGKFLLVGKLNFAADNLSITARMYADVSKIDTGDAAILFLAEIPEQFRFLVVEGKFQMGFNGPDGEPVEIPFAQAAPAATPYANLFSPGNGGGISLNEINDQDYIDIAYGASDGANLVASKITDADPEFAISGSGIGNVAFSGAPTEVEDTPGVYRYTFTGAFVPGDVNFDFIAGSWEDESGGTILQNVAETEIFTVQVPSAAIATPEDGGSISIADINAGGQISLRFSAPEGSALDDTTLSGNDIELLCGGVDCGITLGGPTLVTGSPNTYEFSITNGSFTTGQVTVNIAAGAFSDTAGSLNVDITQTFTVYSTTAILINPVAGAQIDVGSLNQLGYLEVQYIPANDGGTITLDGNTQFTLSGVGANGVTFESPVAVDGLDNTYRYYFSDGKAFTTGEVQITYVAGSWEDDANNESIAETQNFISAGPTAYLAGGLEKPIVGL
ncbi:MAG: hypothetical protein H8D37_04135, partial [Chloroflexi bacterium]|nr:hypothetical protein [Chloroflexota bacterium]